MGFLGSYRRNRKARRLLSALFDRPDLAAMSSLRPAHKSRAVFLDAEGTARQIRRIRFGLVRHPRAANVRGVHNEVVEIYEYDLEKDMVTVAHSRNITKRGMPDTAGE